MSLQYVIDGYNLIHHRMFKRCVPPKETDAAALIHCIRQRHLTGKSANRVIIVFDGYPRVSSSLGEAVSIEVVFSKDTSADEIIMRLVERAAHPRTIRVVSDDNQIRLFVTSCGAKAIRVDEFFEPLNPHDSPVHGKHLRATRDGLPDQKVSFSEMSKINKELRERWLR